MKRKIGLVILICFSLTAASQFNSPNPSVPSANLANSKRTIQVSNDLFNGKANVTLPLFEYTFEGITWPLQLSYAGGNGIKTDEIPSWVGLGWNLQAGGYVHRTVRGKADEAREFKMQISVYPVQDAPPIRERETTLHSTDYSYFTNYYRLNSTSPLWSSQAHATSITPNGSNYPYSLPITNGTGTFYNDLPLYDLVPDEFTFSVGNISGKFYFSQDNKWVVASNDGRSYSVSITTGQQPINSGQRIEKIIKYIVLTSNDGIKFYFGNSNVNAPYAQQLFEHSHSSNSRPINPWEMFPIPGGDHIDAVPHTWHISKIENTKTGSVITFDYIQPGLQYYKSRQAWGNIGGVVYSNNNIFYTNTEDPGSAFRLSAISKIATRFWLPVAINFPDGVKIEFQSSLSTQMSTNEFVDFSDNSDFHEYHDFWGYSGGNKLYKLNKIVVSVNNETKKEIAFTYFENQNHRMRLTAVKDKNSSGSSTNEYQFTYNSTQLPVYAAGKSDHWGYYNNKDFFSSVAAPYNYTKLLDYASYREPDIAYLQAEILTRITYPTGGFIDFQYEPHDYRKKRSATDYSLSTLGSNEQGGGVRVKKMIYRNKENAVEYEKEYLYTDPANAALSSGVLSSPPPDYLVGNSGSFAFRSWGFSPVYYTGSPVTYTYVTEKMSGNGKSVFNYSNYDNGFNDGLPIEMNTGPVTRFEYAMKNNMFKRGKLLNGKVYKENSTLVKESIYTYEHDNSESNKDEVRSFYFKEQGTLGFYYASVSERIYTDFLIAKEDKEYFDNGNYATKTYTAYDVFGNPKEIRTTDSKGIVLRQKIKYCHEYASTGTDNIGLGVKYLNDNSIKSAVIEKISFRENPNGSNSQVISSQLFTYKTNSVFPDKTYKLQVTAPVAAGSFTESTVSGASFVKDNRYSSTADITYENYDSKGNLLQGVDEKGITHSYIWGYNQTYKIASVDNAAQNSIAYTSFETNEAGGWTGITTANIVSSSSAPTGVKCLQQSGSISKTGLPSGENYVVSYWTRNASSLSVNGATGTAGRTFDGWTYYQHVISNPGSGTITITLNGTMIDEVRLYPQKSLMTTYTHNPLIGLTSQCDPSNHINYYMYDGYGRLLVIKDQYKNVIRSFCYNFHGEPENCNFPGIYYSSAYNVILNRNNCTPPKIGTPVNVQIPAGQFTSAISQEDANSQLAAYAQTLANQQGRCIDPVYARLEIEPDQFDQYTYESYDPYMYDTYVNQFVNVYIRFYSDAACSQPYTLTSNTYFEVRWANDMFYEDHMEVYYGIYSGTALIGTNEHLVEGLTSIYGDWTVLGENNTLIWFERWKQIFSIDVFHSDCLVAGSVYYINNLPPWYW